MYRIAETKRIPIYGVRPPCAYDSRQDEHNSLLQMERMERSKNPANPEVVYYDTSDEEDNKISNSNMLNTSYNVVDYIRSREYGMKEYHSVKHYYGTRQMITSELFREQSLLVNSINKVLCSQWLNSKNIIIGTRCHKLMTYNVNLHKFRKLPFINLGMNETENEQSGIYSLKINPSRSLLATTSYNSNEIAVYQLPEFEPVALAQSNVTKECIFAIEWLDNEFFVSGSKDAKLAIWYIRNECEDEYDAYGDPIIPSIKVINPTVIKSCMLNHDIRAIKFNTHLNEIVTLSPNGYIHVWDAGCFKQKFSKKITNLRDNVCMAMQSDKGLFAIGCSRYPILVDTRTLSNVKCIPMKHDGCGVRSLSFEDNVITVGTSIGVMMFYDIRANKFLNSVSSGRKRLVVMRTSDGFVDRNEHYDTRFPTGNYTPAINTHCYDYSGTRLFTAGGPVSDNINGCYAGLWQ